MRSGGLLEEGRLERESAVIWPDGDVFQRIGQTCPAAFGQFWRASRSCAYRWRSQSADRPLVNALPKIQTMGVFYFAKWV